MTEKLMAALAYAKAGIRIVPLHHIENGCCSCKAGISCISPGKHPRTKDGLDDATTDRATIKAWWKKWPDANIGGMPSEDWFVLDVDDGKRKNKKGEVKLKEGSKQLAELEDENGAVSKRVVQKTGSGGRHILLRLPEGRQPPKRIAKDIDTKGSTGYIVLAPSNHISGNNYEWVGFEPSEIGERLEKIRNAPDWIWDNSPDGTVGGEDEIELLIANQTKNIDDETFADAVRHVPNVDDSYDDWLEMGMAIHHQMNGSQEGLELWQEWSRQSDKHEEDYTASKWDSFGQYTHRRMKTAAYVIMRAHDAGWSKPEPFDDDERDQSDSLQNLLGSSEVEVTNERPGSWPDLRILDETRFPAPKLPIELFGKFWADQIKKWAENSGSCVDFSAAALMGVAASLIGNARRVQVREGWVEPCILWIQAIGTPSSNKSPAMDPVLKVLSEIEAKWIPDHEQAVSLYNQQKVIAKIKKKKWESDCIRTVEDGGTPPDMPADAAMPKPPQPRRVMLIDTTVEALVSVSSANPRGLLSFRDELSGWYAAMTRYSGESSDRPIWLEAYGGRKYISDRVKNEGVPVVVDRFAVSLLGGIQPDRLRKALMEGEEAIRDGLQPRFLPIWPEHKDRKWTKGVKTDNAALQALVCLADLPMIHKDGKPPQSVVVPFSPDAEKVFADWYDTRTKQDGTSIALLADSLGKADGHVARLALLFEYLWYAQPLAEFDPPPGEVSSEAVKAAIRFREEYLKPMQVRTYSMHGRSQIESSAIYVAQWIQTERPEYITARMLVRERVIPGMSITEETNKVISYLCLIKWLLPAVEDDSKRKKGRPQSPKFPVNPMLWDALRERR